jgi:hypothetical protein
MRPRTEAILAVSGLTVLALIVAVLGRSRERLTPEDDRPSTLLAGPGGSRALLDAMPRLGIAVRRFRQRPRELVQLGDVPRQALVVIGPSFPFSPPERTLLLGFNRRADLVLAGKSAERLMRCYGYRVERRFTDSLRAAPPGAPAGARSPWVHARLVRTGDSVYVDSSRVFDVARVACRIPPIRSVETLLVAGGHRAVALRLQRDDFDRRVVLVADEELFRNRALRHTDAGPFALGLFAGRYDRVIFEEYHHGFGASGSLAGATIAWSVHSPWGWAVWQAAVVGLLALLFSAVRFGPVRPAIPRSRRSSLEHVRALATALAAAQGHDVAIGAIVRGLRRRLLPPGLRTRGDWRGWLQQLDQGSMTPRAREAVAELDSLTRPGHPSSGVLRAANAVEDLWEELRP